MKLILLGPPGSGKGTVSERLARELGFLHLSMGEILREEVDKKTVLGKEIKKYIEKGKLVPDQLAVEIIKFALREKDNFILDGFPRTVEQSQGISDLGIALVIYLDVPEKVVIDRLAGRRVCEKGEHTYHLRNLPPIRAGICDYDSTKLVQRKDDHPQVIKERFRVYKEKTRPLINYYQERGVLKKVNGSLAPEEVYKKVISILNKATFK